MGPDASAISAPSAVNELNRGKRTVHVALLSSTVEPSCGWGRYTLDYCRALARAPLVTLTLYVSRSDAASVPRAAGFDVIPTLPPWTPTLGSRADTFAREAAFTPACRRPDVIHTLVEFPYAVLARALAVRLGVPYVVSLHGTYAALPFRQPADADEYSQALAGAGAITAPSAYTADAARVASGCDLQIQVIPNAVDAARFERTAITMGAARARRELGLRKGARLILAVGEVKPRKGFDTLLAAFDGLARRRPDVHLAVAGPGNTAPLRECAAALRLGSRVHVLGCVAEPMLVSLFHACDVFCLLPRVDDGRFEGYGLVYLEAGACRKPVVATRSGGVPDAVIDGTSGLLVDEGDTGAAAAAIERILDDGALARRLGDGGWRLAQSRTWTGYAAQMLRIYRRLLTSARSPRRAASAARSHRQAAGR